MTASPQQIVELRTRALEQLAGIEHELMVAFLNRQIYVELRDEFVARFAHADATFLNSYAGLYARGQIMVVRRLADTNDDKPDSVWWALKRIRNNPAIAARRHYLELASEQHPNDATITAEAEHEYTTRYGPAAVPDDATLADMQHRLVSGVVADVLAFADRRIAHRDPRGPLHEVTYLEVDEALKQVALLANEVSMLLRRSTTDYEYVWIGGDWQECFRPSLFPFGFDAYAYVNQSFT